MKVRYGRDGKKEATVELQKGDTIGDLRKRIGPAVKLSWTRLELRSSHADPKQVVKFTGDLNPVSKYGLTNASEIVVKDLGAQFSYRGVFVVEYAGPIAIMLAYALRPAFLFGKGSAPLAFWRALTPAAAEAATGTASWNGFVQALALSLWIAHFAKRELETFFVHKFSRPTMPLFNLFKNSVYYWGFALAVGFPLVHPAYTAPSSKAQVAAGAALWAASQLTNFAVHWQLSRMRPSEGSDARSAPGGLLFSLVSCPNYTAEVLGWVGWSLLSQVGMAYAFTAAGFLQMAQWALAKHRGYLKSDESYKKRGRKAIVPFLL